jgi:hypothetical protein
VKNKKRMKKGKGKGKRRKKKNRTVISSHRDLVCHHANTRQRAATRRELRNINE